MYVKLHFQHALLFVNAHKEYFWDDAALFGGNLLTFWMNALPQFWLIYLADCCNMFSEIIVNLYYITGCLITVGSDFHCHRCDNLVSHIHSFSILSDDRSKASSKTMPPYSAMQSLLLQMRISSPVLKVIQ